MPDPPRLLQEDRPQERSATTAQSAEKMPQDKMKIAEKHRNMTVYEDLKCGKSSAQSRFLPQRSVFSQRKRFCDFPYFSTP
jgi:hypothetical protein